MQINNISTTSSVNAMQGVSRRRSADNAISENGRRQDKQPAKNFETKHPENNASVSIGELELIEAIEKANKAVQGVNKRFEFSIHEQTRTIMVKVINNDNDEVIREIPPEKILNMVAKMWELAGILVDEKV